MKIQGGGGALESEHLYSTSPHTKSLPQPIGRPERTTSASSDSFQRAVGAEVKSKSLEDEGQVQVQHSLSSVCLITRDSMISHVLVCCHACYIVLAHDQLVVYTSVGLVFGDDQHLSHNTVNVSTHDKLQCTPVPAPFQIALCTQHIMGSQ